MSFSDGWAAVNLEMPGRVPRIEFGPESHWPLFKRVTGLDVHPHSPDEVKLRAMQAMSKAWNYDIRLTCIVGHEELASFSTNMGHGAFEMGGTDLDYDVRCPFDTPEQALAFAPWETYGVKHHAELVRRFNADYYHQCADYPDLVSMTGTYVTLFSGMIAVLGWDMFLAAGGYDPAGMGAVLDRYARWMQQYYDALAESDTPVIYSHDDIVWSTGAVFRPEWYRQYVFPHYKQFWAPCIEAGKKVIFVADGNYTEFVDDIAAQGCSGFFFEPLTDLEYVVEGYGQSHIIVGNADTRALLANDKAAIRAEVERCTALGKHCPGYFMNVSNMIPYNTPVEAALYYNEVYEELCWR